MTFAEFAKQYYLPHAKEHKKTWDDDVWKVEKLLNPALGKQRLSGITTRDVALLCSKEKARTSATTANHLLSTLKRMLNLAVKSDQDEEEDGLSVAAIRLLLFTGCRRGEVMSLKWNEVRLDEDCISLLDTKNGRSRMVHLNAWAKEVVEELHESRGNEARTAASDYVFPSRQGTKKGHLFDLRNPFDKACQRAGVENFRIHDLRHTFASMAVRGGASLFDVQKLLGHQDIAMTQRYAHLSDDGLKKVTAGVATMLDEAA